MISQHRIIQTISISAKLLRVGDPRSVLELPCSGSINQGGVVFFSSTTRLVEPSGDTVVSFFFVSTVPSLLIFSLSDLDIVRSQPVVRTAKAKADITANSAVLRVFMVCSPSHDLQGKCRQRSDGFERKTNHLPNETSCRKHSVKLFCGKMQVLRMSLPNPQRALLIVVRRPAFCSPPTADWVNAPIDSIYVQPEILHL